MKSASHSESVRFLFNAWCSKLRVEPSGSDWRSSESLTLEIDEHVGEESDSVEGGYFVLTQDSKRSRQTLLICERKNMIF